MIFNNQNDQKQNMSLMHLKKWKRKESIKNEWAEVLLLVTVDYFDLGQPYYRSQL